MKNLYAVLIVLLAAVIACSESGAGVAPSADTQTPFAAVTATATTDSPSPTPQHVVDGQQLLTDSWITALTVKQGDNPLLLPFDADWQKGSGFVGWAQQVDVAGEGGLSCKLATTVQDIGHSSIVTTTIVARVNARLIDYSIRVYLDTNFHQPESREWYFNITKDVQSVNVLLGFDKPDTEDSIHYKLVDTTFICYHQSTTNDTNFRSK